MIAEDTGSLTSSALVSLLARSVQKIATASGDHRTAIPELTLHRRNRPSQPVHCVYTLGMAVTVQGSKHVLLGERDLSYGPGQSLLTAIDLPVSYHITRASAAEPYLGIMLKLDPSVIKQVATSIEPPRSLKEERYEPLSIQRLDSPVLDALLRLIGLLSEPPLIPQLAPLFQREIVIRLLTGPHSLYLWHLVNAAGPTQRIAQAVTWIRQHFAKEMRVEELAEHANMSLTTFRQHFRMITGMSPVQFQKQLRLQEARQLMLDQNMSAGSASALVGYESASHFNREYRRLFGAPPQKDIRRLLNH